MAHPMKKIIAVPRPHVDAPRETDFWRWYWEVLDKGEMTDRESPGPGCYTLKPASYALWKNICRFLEERLQQIGVREFAFPLRTGDDTTSPCRAASALAPYLSRWIADHRDLPLRLNQWTLTFSPEDSTAPFLRCSQYLVQEAYSAHLTQHGARVERDQILEIYSALYEELLAVPVIRGHRTASNNRNTTENPADELTTSIVLGYLPTLNRWIEAGTFRELGQTLSREHNITVPAPLSRSAEETDEDPIYVWQNTWTLTTRSIGLMIVTHADNRGLVFPPRVAPTQVLLIPTVLGLAAEARQTLRIEAGRIQAALVQRGIRAVADVREERSDSWKWHEGVVNGVPVLLLLGMEGGRDLVATVFRRDLARGEAGAAVRVRVEDLETEVPRLLEEIQNELFQRAGERFSLNSRRIEAWDEFVRGFGGEHADGNGLGGCLVPHCLDKDCECEIEALVAGGGQAASDTSKPPVRCVCIPWDQPDGIEGKGCINPSCTNAAKKWVLSGYEY